MRAVAIPPILRLMTVILLPLGLAAVLAIGTLGMARAIDGRDLTSFVRVLRVGGVVTLLGSAVLLGWSVFRAVEVRPSSAVPTIGTVREQPIRRLPATSARPARWRSPLANGMPRPPFAHLSEPKPPPTPSDTPRMLGDVSDAAFEAEEAGDLERAIALHSVLLGELGSSAAYDLASAYARARKPDAALYYLQTATASYESTTEALDTDSGLAPLRADRRFAELRAYSAAMDAAWARMHHRIVRLTTPTGYDASVPIPTLIGLHGYLSGPDDFYDGPEWQLLADRNSIAIISVSATTPHAPRSFVWSSDATRDLQQIHEALQSVRGLVHVDPAHLILIGFSQGADVSLRLLAAAPDEFRGVVSISPGNADDAPDFDAIGVDLRDRTVVFAVGGGEHPSTLATVRRHVQMVDAAGGRSVLRETPEQRAHTFPDDLGAILPVWLARIDPAFAP